MKRVLIIGGIVVLFLILLAAILWKVIAPTEKTTVQTVDPVLPVSTNNRDPMSFIASCYKEYVGGVLSGDNRVPTQTVLDNNLVCFTADFQNNWSNIAEDTEMDPVVITPTVEPVGDLSSAIAPNGDATASGEYLLTLGTGANKRTLVVTLVSESDGIKISSVDLKPN